VSSRHQQSGLATTRGLALSYLLRLATSLLEHTVNWAQRKQQYEIPMRGGLRLEGFVIPGVERMPIDLYSKRP
jgi:hypothetical protein